MELSDAPSIILLTFVAKLLIITHNMKKIFKTLLFAVPAIAFLAAPACKEDDGGKFDPFAKIWINGKNTTNKAQTTQQRLTAEQICKGDSVYLCGNQKPDNTGGPCTGYMIKPTYDGYLPIDTVNNRLPMVNGNVDDGYTPLDENVFLSEQFNWFVTKMVRYTYINERFECVYSDKVGDTIGYIPTAVRLAAREELRKLWDDRDANREAIYKIFNEAFVFYPCTGAEYKRMLEEGIE